MTTAGCQTCGGYGNRHDPVAHDEWADRCDNCGQPADVCGGCLEDEEGRVTPRPCTADRKAVS